MVARILTVTALAGALGVAGCTSSTGGSSASFTGAQADVAQVVSDLAKDGQRKDAQKICSEILASELVDKLNQAGTSCGQEMDKAIADADDFDLSVQKVTINGSSAIAVVRRGKDGPTATFRFVREGGKWKATDFGTT
jgi:outer membrane lipoprotein SlyB